MVARIEREGVTVGLVGDGFETPVALDRPFLEKFGKGSNYKQGIIRGRGYGEGYEIKDVNRKIENYSAKRGENLRLGSSVVVYYKPGEVLELPDGSKVIAE